MKNIKEVLLFTVLFILLVGVSSASDVSGDTDVAGGITEEVAMQDTCELSDTTNIIKESKADDTVETNKLSDNDIGENANKTSDKNTKNIKKDMHVNNWETFQSTLSDLNSHAENDVTVILDNDIYLNPNPIVWSNDKMVLTIDGNGHEIDANHKKVFNIEYTGTLILKNIMIRNAYSHEGGAINNQGRLSIYNSTLINNYAETDGGAIANKGNLTIINCNLTNNNASNYGGAVDNDGDVIIIGSNLTYNYAGLAGGAIINYNKRMLNITNSTLSYNNASDGGAIRNSGNVTITGCNFTNNNAMLDQGAIDNVRNCYVSDTLFYNNTPVNFIIDENNHIQLENDDGFISIGDFTIVTDYKLYQGNGLEQLQQYIIPRGAPNVKLLLNGTNITNNIFIIKKAPEDIIPLNISNYDELVNALKDDTQSIKILNITSNITLRGNPKTNSSIKTLIINGNQNTINGGGSYHFLDLTNQTGIINNITVIRCDVSGYGGAITNEGNLTIFDSVLNNNSAWEGGALDSSYGANITIVNCTFNYNYASAWGGALDNDGNMTIIGSNINYNTAEFDGGAIKNYNPRLLNITDSNITHNTANRDGGAIINYGQLIITGSYVADNKANSGGAILNDGRYNISNTTFFNNIPVNFNITRNNKIQLLHDDGFISIADFTILTDNQTYHGNGLEELQQITVPSRVTTVKLVLNGTNATDNTFFIKGSPGPINIKNYEELNAALISGAESIKVLNITANITLKGNLTINTNITSLTIIGNQKIIDGNGSYHFINITNEQSVILNNITITDCYSINEGGAIINEGTLIIMDSNLNNNNASWFGGAICNYAQLTVINSTFANNKANDGGAINNMGLLTISDSLLVNNTVNREGGAIRHLAREYCTIVNSNFTNNNASSGGAIYASGYSNLTGNTFTNNTADNNESIDLHNNNGLFNGNVYKSTDIALNIISLSIKDNKTLFTTNEEVVLNFTIALEHPNYYDNDVLERLEDITVYVNGMEYATTGYENLTLSGLEPGEYTVGYKTCNRESNNVTFTVISVRLTKTTAEILSSDCKNVTIKTMTTDTDDIAVTNGTIIVRDMDENVLTTMNVCDGVAVIVIPESQPGKLELIVEYQENDYYHASIAVNTSAIGTPYENVTIIDVMRAKTIITLSDMVGYAGETVTITANVADVNGDMVTGGKVAFKVNGKTLKDDNGKVIYVKVVNGMASIQWTVPEEFADKNVTITATYSGSTIYDQSNTNVTTTVTKAVPTITTSDITAAKGETITLTATITYNDNVINTGKVVFKINGKTVKDASGKVIYARVIDGMATIEYTIPESMKSKDYTLTAIFTSTKFDRVEDTRTLTVI